MHSYIYSFILFSGITFNPINSAHEKSAKTTMITVRNKPDFILSTSSVNSLNYDKIPDNRNCYLLTAVKNSSAGLIYPYISKDGQGLFFPMEYTQIQNYYDKQ